MHANLSGAEVQLFYPLRWLIYVFNPVVNTKLPVILSHRRSTTVSLETYPFIQVFRSLVRQFETFSYSNLSFRKFNFLWLLTTFIISLMSGNVLIFFFICYSKLSLSNLSLTSFPLLFRPLRFSNILLCRALQS